MKKLKTKKSAAKRFYISKSKILRAKAGHRHNLGVKSKNSLRFLTKKASIASSDLKTVKKLLIL